MTKRKLLLSHQYNYRGIKSYEALMMLHAREDLKVHFNDPNVDILPWSSLQDIAVLNVYDTVIMMEFPFSRKFVSKHRKYLKGFLRKFSGQKYCLYRDPSAQFTSSINFKRLLKDYYRHDITQQVEQLKETKIEIVYGSDLALTLWTPYSRIELLTDFNFPLYDQYSKATFCFESYAFYQKAHLYTLVDNLEYRICSVPAPYKKFIMPCNQGEFYISQFTDYLREKITPCVDEVLELVPEKGLDRLWLYNIWDFSENELKGEPNFEPIN